MTKESISDAKLSRRQFMGTAAAGAAALGAVAGASSLVPQVLGAPTAAAKELNAVNGLKAAPVPVPKTWSQTTDVVVVGYGGAGAVAAMSAFDAGANVIILEKSPSLASLGVSTTNPPNVNYTISGGGGNTHMSGGQCVWPSDIILGTEHVYAISWGETPYDVCEAWATVANGNQAWYKKMGIPFTVTAGTAEFPNLVGASAIQRINTTGSGAALFAAMDKAIQSRGIPVLFNTPGTHLIQDPTTREVLGVQAFANSSETLNIKANRAVILCTGGFENNEAMMANYLKSYPNHFWGWQYNTGDGINMALEAGAGLWHMNAASSTANAWNPAYVASYSCSVKNNAYIFVNKYGQRWVNESTKSTFTHTWAYYLADFNLAEPGYTRIPYFIIFDSTAMKAGALGSTSQNPGLGITVIPPQVGGGPTWSTDNSAELKAGLILQGATSLSDLVNSINSAKIVSSNWANAEPIQINLSLANLTAAVNQWNADCAAGKGDTVFGRAATAMLPISTPPFYAIPQWPGGPNTQGGPIRNAKAQVCDPFGNAIPRLYSNGECGSIWGFLYASGGGDISELVAFGQIAGNNAATEVPLS
ncbi:MAG: FAD-binding protein [Nitrososphaerales archaeon]